MAKRHPQRDYRWERTPGTGLILPRRPYKWRHIEKNATAQCCCDLPGCRCSSCLDNIAACCYSIEIDDEIYAVTWTGSCSWVDDTGNLTMSISDTTLTITDGENTWETTIDEDADCLTWIHVEVPATDQESESAYVTADGIGCSDGCLCICDVCESKLPLGNATCCWSVKVGGYWYHLLRSDDEEEDECVWSCNDCHLEGTITLTVDADGTTFDYNGNSWSTDSAQCCAAKLVLSSDGYSDVTLYGSDTDTCISRKYDCAQLTISGVENTCACAACDSQNGTWSLGWTGTGYMGYFCSSTSKIEKCGYTCIQASFGGGKAVVWLMETCYDMSPPVRFDGVYESGETTCSLSFTSSTDESCDWSSASMTLSLGPECAPCGDNQACIETPCPCAGCKDCAYPDAYEITIPDGFIGSWGCGAQTFIVPKVSDGYCTKIGGAAPGYYKLTTSNIMSCSGLPGEITIEVGNSIYVELKWYYWSYSWYTRLRFSLGPEASGGSGFVPSDYCSGDSNLVYDCALYGTVQTLTNISITSNCGTYPYWSGNATIEAL